MTETLPADYYQRSAPIVADWCNIIGFSPSAYFSPRHVDDLIPILETVLRRGPGATVRVMGGLHSCSAIFEGETVIDTSALPLEFDVVPHAGGGRIVASAWMHVHEFGLRAAAHNLSLTALGGTDAQTLAGLISTDTAGATIRHSVYETLAWVEFLTVAPDGNHVHVRRIARGEADFGGVVASLGAIGMLTRVAFDLVDQRFFEAGMELRSLTDILGDLDATNAKYDFWRIEWLPNNDDVGNFWYAQRTLAGVDPDGDYPDDVLEPLLSAVLSFDHNAFGGGPLLSPLIDAAYGMMIKAYQPTKAVGPLRNMIPLDRKAPIRVAMAEWSVAPHDLPRVMDVCRTYWRAHGFPNLSTEIQCMGRDDFWMSAWNWPELKTNYIVKLNFQYITDYLSADDKTAMIAHLKGLWDALDAAGIIFKAHWGKINFLDVARVRERYQLDKFMRLAKPMFANAYLRERLAL